MIISFILLRLPVCPPVQQVIQTPRLLLLPRHFRMTVFILLFTMLTIPLFIWTARQLPRFLFMLPDVTVNRTVTVICYRFILLFISLMIQATVRFFHLLTDGRVGILHQNTTILSKTPIVSQPVIIQPQRATVTFRIQRVGQVHRVTEKFSILPMFCS